MIYERKVFNLHWQEKILVHQSVENGAQDKNSLEKHRGVSTIL
jgi:hypothetical protein